MIRVRAVIAGVSGLPGLSTFYFTGESATPTTAEANDATGRVRAVWDAVKSVLAAGTTISVQQQVDKLDFATGDLLGRVSAASAPSIVTSTGTGELPPATALGIRLNTIIVVNGRILQGRAFISPLATAAATNGLPSSTAVTQGNLAAAALQTGATPISPAVWHRPTPGGSNGTTGNIASGGVDSSKLWVLRSRRD